MVMMMMLMMNRENEEFPIYIFSLSLRFLLFSSFLFFSRALINKSARTLKIHLVVT